MRVWGLLLLGSLSGFAPRSALAWDHDDHERKHWRQDDGWDRDHHRRYGEACFRDDHVRMIREYYHPRDLPPGLQKKLYRTGRLPPGWEGRVRPFPLEIERRLPPLCVGCARGYLDGYAVVYQPRTRVIVDFHALIAP